MDILSYVQQRTVTSEHQGALRATASWLDGVLREETFTRGRPGDDDALTRLQRQRAHSDNNWWHQSEPDLRTFNHSRTLPSITESLDRSDGFTQTEPCALSRYAPSTPWYAPSDAAVQLCAVFWRPALTFHPYRHGDPAVDFAALWPSEAELRRVLRAAVHDGGLWRSTNDLARVAALCAPVRVLKALVDLRIVGVNHRFENGQTLLHMACVGCHAGIAVYLLRNRANRHIRDHAGQTARQVCHSPKIMKVLAEESGTFYGHITMDTVTDRLRDKVKVMPSLHDKQVIFDLAHDPKDTDKLLSKLQMFEFDVNKESDEQGDYLIHIASRQGISQVPLLELLKKICRADMNVLNKDGHTAVMLAAVKGDSTMVDTLLCVFGADPDVAQPITGRRALHQACQRNDLDTVSILVRRGADYNLEDSDGARPDDLAAIFRATDCRGVIQRHRDDRIHALAQRLTDCELSTSELRPTDLYLTDADGYTLTMLAARHNCTDTLGWLCAQTGASIDAQHSQTLKTALSYAAKSGHDKAVDILLQHGANPAIKDINGYLAVHNAAIHHQTAALTVLLQQPAALTGLYSALQLSRHPVIQRELQNAIHSRQRTIVLPVLFETCVSGDAGKLYQVLEEGDNVNQMSGLGDWPIYLAAENGHLEVVKLLYELGGDLQWRHLQTGNSVLHAAAGQGHLEVTDYILRQCAAQTSHQGSIINALNYGKETPLMRAANKGSFRVVQLLLSRGATSSVICPHTGRLFTCGYEGLQYIIDNHRRDHTAAVMAAMGTWKPVSKLRQIFLPQFDHNLRGPHGDTPLMLACRTGKLGLVRFLLESAVYNIVPSPPSTNKLSLLCYDSDADSGIPDIASVTFPDQPIRSPDPPVAVDAAVTMATDTTFYLPLDTEAEEERSVRDNISTLLDSIASVSRQSVFVTHKRVSHVCAVNPSDGRTSYHRAIEGGDAVSVISALLDSDPSGVNMQDRGGVSPLHLACRLGRRRVTERLVTEPFVDVNSRTLDGKLPEEMATNKAVAALVLKARKQQPISASRFSPLTTLSSSLFGVTSSQYSEDQTTGSVDFDLLNTRFMLLKHDLGGDVNMFL